MKAICLITGVLWVFSVVSHHANAQDIKQMVVAVCSNCHGVDGNSIHPRYPNVAGQAREYLLAQLKAFRDKSRKDPDAHAFMWGVSAQLTDGQVVKLAEYFSAQKPAPGKPGDAQLAAKGKVIYESGIKSKNVPACAFCHGITAHGTAVIPRLAGQHAEYLRSQIKVFHLDYRPGLAVTMKAVVERLTEEEAAQVAEYLQGL